MDGRDLANIFNDEEAGRANSISSSDLDPFLLQGDDQTWEPEEWNWDPFNMFAAPKEVPNVACCQALKRRKVLADESATSAAQLQQQQQAQHGACQPGHGHGGGRAGPPAAPAACCSMTNMAQAATQQQTMAGPLQAALNSLMPNRVASDACAVPMSCHAPLMAPPPAVPTTARVAAAGPAMGMGGMGGMAAMGMPNLAWPSMSAAAAAVGASFFPGGQGPLAAMGWGAQPLSLQMPSLALPAFPGAHAQCVPAMSMPSFPAPNSGIFNQQASMAMPPSALPSPALGSSGETSSLQGSADNAKPPCCSGNRAVGGPTCSGGRQQADSSNKPAAPPPKSHQPPQGGRGGAEMAAPADLSDFGLSESEDDDEVARRGPTGQRGGQQQQAAPQAPLPLQHVPRDVVALNDVDDNGLMVCQVAGCGKDLTNLKDYHQRYRICDVHIKLQQVLKDGRLQRFCQQCGRFHDLTAFDGNRKSCRDQLSKHNARRRRRAQAEQAKSKAAANEAGAAEAAAAMPAAGGSATFGADVSKLITALMQNPTQLHALRLMLGVPTHPALPSPADATSDGSEQLRTYSLARDILGGRNEFAPAFESEHRLVRLSLKLFNKTPADLPLDLRNQVTSWMASAPTAMEAAIRPGCVFLTVQMLVDAATAAQMEAPGALPGLAQHLLTRTGCPFWHSGTYTMQLGVDMLLVRDGNLCGDAASGRGDGRFPTISRMGPLAVVAGEPAVLKMHGHHLDAPNCSVILRWGTKHLKAHLQAVSEHRAIVRLPPLPADVVGPVWVEVTRGAYLSPPKLLLVCSNQELVTEINKLDVRNGPLSAGTVEAMLRDLALVLQHMSGQPGVTAQVEHAVIALKARRLLAMACDMGWAAVASAVLPLACARCSCAAEMVAAIHAASVPATARGVGAAGEQRGLTLLHRAVRSGSIALLAGMLAWGDSHGYRWRVDAAGPAGITPLHLAAMMDDARMGLLLLDHCGWPAAFTHLKSDGGVTPFHLAFQMGHYQVDSLMAALGGLHQVDPHSGANNAAGAAAAATPAYPAGRRSRCGSTCPGGGLVMGCKAEEDEDVKPDLRAMAAGGGGGHRGGSELNPCDVCQCTLPPLLLSIMASCNECGRRRMCMEDDAAAAACRCSSCACGGARPALRSDSGEVCSSRQHSTIFSITALCQGCHANRVLAVA